MIDQNIGNPEITRKHLSEMQTFYEAQLVAKRHYDALMTSLKPLQDAADVLRASGVVNVDALLSQPVSATKAMIDEMEAEADELNDLTPHEGEEEAEDLPPMPEGEGWKRNTGDQPFTTGLLVEVFCRNGKFYREDVSEFIWPVGENLDDDIIWYREAQPVEQEAEPAPAPEGFIPWEAGPDPLREFDDFDYKAFSKAGAKVWFAFDSQQSEYNWNIPWDEEMWTHEDMPQEGRITALKLPEGYELVDAEGGKVIRKIDHAAEATAQIEASIDERPLPEFDEGDRFEIRGTQSVERNRTTGTVVSSKFQEWGQNYIYVVRRDGAEQDEELHPSVMFPIVEAQAEPQSTETEAEPDTAETMQAIAQAVEAVDAEPEVATDETVTEQPETASDDVEEDEDPRWQADPSGKWTEAYKHGPRGASDEMIETGDKVTCSDFEGDRLVLETQWVVDEVIGWSLLLEGEDQMFDSESCSLVEEKPEVIAPVGSANFDPRVQSDDIAAAEREEFNRPRVHNPWFTAKAEG